MQPNNKLINIDPTTLSRLEKGETRITEKAKAKIDEF
jgi:hypothetical protein